MGSVSPDMATTETRPLPDAVDVVVVGAGLAGLAAARSVHGAGRSVAVLEASDGVGGRVRTDIVNGFRLDRGFQVLLTAYPEVQRQLDLDALQLRAFLPGSLVWTGERPYAVGDPFRKPSLLLPSAVAPIGSVADKARMAALLRRVKSADPKQLLRGPDIATMEALHAAGFGPRIIDRFFRPLIGGIQLDPSLSGSARMFETILHCLAVGESAVPAEGMQAVPTQLASRLPGGTVHLSTPVAAVTSGEVRLSDGRVVAAQRVIVATEGPAAAALLPVLNGAVMSNVAPEYVTSAAPVGHALIAAACPDTADVADLAKEARAQLRRWWGPQVDQWSTLRVDTIAHGQPVAAPPFAPKRHQSLGEGLWVCGDHVDTPSIQGALYSGRRCGEAVAASFTSVG